MVDCVGYMVEGALGSSEGEQPRMVRTPWFDYDIPFDEAAELGTRKVITEHSTIGIVILTDGSITGISREAYAPAEEAVLREMQNTGKPYIIILNSSDPTGQAAAELSAQLSEKYGAPVKPLDVLGMELSDIDSLLEGVLQEFPLGSICIEMPEWMRALGTEHCLVKALLDRAKAAMPNLNKMRDAALIQKVFGGMEDYKPVEQVRISLGSGSAVFRLVPNDDVFYRVLSEEYGPISAAVRKRLVALGTADLPKVILHDSGPYIVSAATFPSYFLKQDQQASQVHAQLDLAVFERIARQLNIGARYVGEEPFSQVTALYNRTMAEMLPASGVDFLSLIHI